MSLLRRHVAALAVLFAFGCQDDPESVHETATQEELYPDGCDPIVAPEYCGYPFPTDVWTVADESSVTGRRVRFHRTRMAPAHYDDTASTSYTIAYQDPTLFDDFDGFSAGTHVVFNMPGATPAGMATVGDLARSLADDSPVVILDAETGERVPHFVELDPRPDLVEQQMFLVRPVVRLRSAHRYVVAIRGVVDADGRPVAPTKSFRALRDGRRDDAHPSIAHRRARYRDLFAFLEEHGVARSSLQLAWDFTTGSDQHVTARLRAMITSALAELGDGTPQYAITSSEDDVDAFIARRIEGTVRVPMYLDGTGGPGATMFLDAAGMPERHGFVDVPFLLQIPRSAVGTTESAAKPVMQHGHGLFQDRFEADGGSFRSYADETGHVLFSMDWWGLANGDLGATSVVARTGDARSFRTVPDRGQQAMLNFIVGLRAALRGLAADPATFVGGFPTIDPDDPRYFGVSLGGIYGSVLLTLSPDVDRGLLMVPGQPFNLLLPRNTGTYSALYVPLSGNLANDPSLVPLALEAIQMLWDRVEPNGYAHLMLEDPQDVLPFAHEHHVFILDAIGDKTVTTLGANIMARTLHLPVLAPNPRPVFGLVETPGPFTGSGFAELDYGPPESLTQIANPMGGDPHVDPIGRTTGIVSRAMGAAFLADGTIANLCSGTCDPD